MVILEKLDLFMDATNTFIQHEPGRKIILTYIFVVPLPAPASLLRRMPVSFRTAAAPIGERLVMAMVMAVTIAIIAM